MFGRADASSIDVEGPGCSRVGPVASGLLVLSAVVYPGRENGQDDADNKNEEECFRVKRKCLLKLLSYLVRLLLLQQLCLLYTSPSPRDLSTSRMPSSA